MIIFASSPNRDRTTLISGYTNNILFSDKISLLLLSTADWLSLAVGHVYYEVKKQKQNMWNEVSGKPPIIKLSTIGSCISCPAMTSPEPSVYTRPFTSYHKSVRPKQGRGSKFRSCRSELCKNICCDDRKTRRSGPIGKVSNTRTFSKKKIHSSDSWKKETARQLEKDTKKHKSCCCCTKISKNRISKGHRSSADFYV